MSPEPRDVILYLSRTEACYAAGGLLIAASAMEDGSGEYDLSEPARQCREIFKLLSMALQTVEEPT